MFSNCELQEATILMTHGKSIISELDSVPKTLRERENENHKGHLVLPSAMQDSWTHNPEIKNLMLYSLSYHIKTLLQTMEIEATLTRDRFIEEAKQGPHLGAIY